MNVDILMIFFFLKCLPGYRTSVWAAIWSGGRLEQKTVCIFVKAMSDAARNNWQILNILIDMVTYEAPDATTEFII